MTSYRSWGGETIAPPPVPPAGGSSTRGGSASIRGRVLSPHISGGRPAAGSQRTYSLGWDRRTDRQAEWARYRLKTPPPTAEGIIG